MYFDFEGKRWEWRHGPASVNRLSAVCDLLQRTHECCAQRERQTHADITTLQSPPQVSTSSLRTQPLSYRGPNVPRYKEIIYKTPSTQHDEVGLIYHLFLISAFLQKNHEDSWRVWGVLGTELLLVPPPSFLFYWLPMTHWSKPKSPQQRSTVHTKRRFTPEDAQLHPERR